MSNITVVNGASYASPFTSLAEELGLNISTNKQLILSSPGEVSLVVFTGGSDVSPEVYKEDKHPSTENSTSRDMEEVKLFKAAKKAGIPMAGICRGSQFLCAMAGGKVIQDVTNHLGNHNIVVSVAGGPLKELEVSSTHHQMQSPFVLPAEDYEIIGWCPSQRSKYYAMNSIKVVPANEANANLKSEPDIVWYPKIKALATQYHPEYMPIDSPGYKLYQELLDVYIKPEIVQHEQNRKIVAKAVSRNSRIYL